MRLYSRPGNDLTYRFPLIVEALARLRSRSCIIDGEAVAVATTGWHPSIASATGTMTRVFLYAFDLIELNGDDLRRDPLEVRKATLASVLARRRRACASTSTSRGGRPDRVRARLQDGLEGIVSKRKDSRYRSGRSPDWLKRKNPAAPAVRREAEEDWGR